MAVSLLAASGLHPAEVRPWPHVTFAGADLGFWVEVPADEAEAARQLLSRPASDESSRPACATPVVLKAAVVVVLVLIALGALIP